MALPFKLYLANIPFINQNVILQNNKQLISEFYKGLYPKIEIVNLNTFNRNRDNSIEFVFTLPQDTFATLSFDKYNAVYFNNDDLGSDIKNYYIYKIVSIKYVSSTRISIAAEPTIYNIVRGLPLGTNTPYVDLTNGIESHATYIESGYAYDSLVNETGYTKFSVNGDTDLYCECPRIEQNFLRSSVRLEQVWSNGSLGGFFNQYLNGWMVMFTLPIESTEETPLMGNHPTFNISTYQVETNYSCFIFPVMYADSISYIKPKIKMRWVGDEYNYMPGQTIDYLEILDATRIDEFIKKLGPQAAKIVSIKYYPYLPLESVPNATISYDATSYTLTIDRALFAGQRTFITKPTVGETNTYNAALSTIVSMDSVDLSTVYPSTMDFTLPDSTVVNFPKCMLGTPLESGDLNSIDENPYVVCNTNSFKLTDFLGSEYTTSFLEMGRCSNITFTMHCVLSPETNDYSIDFNSSNGNSTFNNIPNNRFEKFNGKNNFTLSFALDRMQEYLANHANFESVNEAIKRTQWKRAGSKVLGYTLNGVANMAGTAAMLAGGVIPDPTAMASFAGSGMSMYVNNIQSIYHTYLNTKLFDIRNKAHLDNLRQAPDKIMSATSTMLIAVNMFKQGLYFCWYSADRLSQEQLLKSFIYYGLPLKKFVNEPMKYLTLTGNKYDKTNYKYCHANTEIYCTNIPTESDTASFSDNALRKLENMYATGVRLIDYSNSTETSSYNYASTNNVLLEIREEDFN